MEACLLWVSLVSKHWLSQSSSCLAAINSSNVAEALASLDSSEVSCVAVYPIVILCSYALDEPQVRVHSQRQHRPCLPSPGPASQLRQPASCHVNRLIPHFMLDFPISSMCCVLVCSGP